VKHEGNSLSGRPRSKWESKVTKDRKRIGWDVDWVCLAQGQVVGFSEHGNELYGSNNWVTIWAM
jgi:hypothetical protein